MVLAISDDQLVNEAVVFGVDPKDLASFTIKVERFKWEGTRTRATTDSATFGRKRWTKKATKAIESVLAYRKHPFSIVQQRISYIQVGWAPHCYQKGKGCKRPFDKLRYTGFQVPLPNFW
jgi:hypothetical protein